MRSLLAFALTFGFVVLALPAPHASGDGAIYYSGRWQLTQYWITEEHAGERDRHATPVRARTGAVLAWSCPRFFDDLSMEGTGRTWDGKLLNWDQRVDGHACFVAVDQDSYPYGIGVAGYALVPYRSLAVDRRFIPIGHTVEMPDLTGMPLPDGSRHDGCFVAVDGGGAINGHHIDLFLPGEQAWRDLGRAGFLPSTIRQVVIDSPRCAYARRYARMPLPSDPPLPR
jgi:3D (Asp-Asp-Asp) domain-containing protein